MLVLKNDTRKLNFAVFQTGFTLREGAMTVIQVIHRPLGRLRPYACIACNLLVFMASLSV
jgi:hypothetical protein